MDNNNHDLFLIQSEYNKNSWIEYTYIEAYSASLDEALSYARGEIEKCAKRYYELHGIWSTRAEFFEQNYIGYRLVYETVVNGMRDTLVVSYKVYSVPPVSYYTLRTS